MAVLVNRAWINFSTGEEIKPSEDDVVINVSNRQHDMSPQSIKKAIRMLADRGIYLSEYSLADVLYISPKMWKGEPKKGLLHPIFKMEPAKRFNGNPHVVAIIEGEVVADITAQSGYYAAFARLIDQKLEHGVWFEQLRTGSMMVIPIIYAEEGGITILD